MKEALFEIYERMEKGQIYVLDAQNQPDIPATILLISKISTVVLRTKHQERNND